MQKQLSAADINKKLEGYKACSTAAQFKAIKSGDRVRYMIRGEFRGGGAVKMNKYPEYIVLLNVVNKASWCMQLKDPTLQCWVKSAEAVQKERENKEKIFKLYNEGKLVRRK